MTSGPVPARLPSASTQTQSALMPQTLFDGVCNRPLHPSRGVLVPFLGQQRNPQKLRDDRAIDPVRVPARLRKVRPDEFSLRDELEHPCVD